VLLTGSAWAGDAARGAEILRKDTTCLECHSVRGEGARKAIDLSQRVVNAYTPASLASVLWNHTPQMFEKLAKGGVTEPLVARPQPTEAEWEDIFAYLYSLQFFDGKGDPRNGKQMFAAKQCSACHAAEKLPAAKALPGKAVADWTGVKDPVLLVVQMWNHSAQMKGELAEANRKWPELSARDFLDLTAYVQSLKGSPANASGDRNPVSNAVAFSLPDPVMGEMPFATNCSTCHIGVNALENKLRNQTWMSIGAGMWNHIPLMTSGSIKKLPQTSEDEMRKILAYAWQLQYNGPAGDSSHGKQVFADKRCIECHMDAKTKAPVSPRPGKQFTAFSMVPLGWGPGRVMHQKMLDKGVKWPYLAPRDISDLVAYFNSMR
jgi:mono/diheme cytochrome c family protein